MRRSRGLYASTVTDADAEVVARICRKLDGMPLAIELVASRLSAHGLVEIDELIEGRLRLAWRGRRTAPPRHQSLSAALDWSYELIAPEERTLLEYLSIFPGAFTLQGARALAGHLDDPDAVLIRLEQLVTKSLVASRPRSAQTSFRLLETTRAYATEKLGASGASHVAAFRHASYVLGALKPRSYEPGGERPGGWTHRADLLSDARAALAWVYSDAGEPGTRIPLAAVCARLFVECNLLEECRVWAGRALAELENAPGEQAAKVELFWAFGHAAMFTERNSHECEAALRRGLTLAQEVGDLQNQFRLLSRLHALYRRTYERRKLLDVARLADAVAIEIGHPAALARAHTYIGIAYHLGGDQRLARERLQAGEVGGCRNSHLADRSLCKSTRHAHYVVHQSLAAWFTRSSRLRCGRSDGRRVKSGSRHVLRRTLFCCPGLPLGWQYRCFGRSHDPIGGPFAQTRFRTISQRLAGAQRRTICRKGSGRRRD